MKKLLILLVPLLLSSCSILDHSSSNSEQLSSSDNASSSLPDESHKEQTTYEEFKSLAEACTYGSHTRATIHITTTKDNIAFEEDFDLAPRTRELHYDETFNITMWELSSEPVNSNQSCYEYLSDTSFIVDAKDYLTCCEKNEGYIEMSLFYKNPLSIRSTSGSGSEYSSTGLDLTLYYGEDLFPYKIDLTITYNLDVTSIIGIITYLD